MSTPSPRPDMPTSTLPAPQPTHPVAGRSVAEEAPEFRWTTIPDADAYRLQLAASDAFESLFYDQTVDGPTAVSLEEVLPDDVDTVVWRVRAEGGADASWSGAASFSVAASDDAGGAQFLVDAPPVPIRPIQGDSVEARGATLTWEGVPEASGYRVQVARSEAFDEPLADLTLDRTSTLTLFDALPEEQASVFWRVRALFPNDTEGPWSESVQFATVPGAGEEAGPAPEPEEEAAPSTQAEAPSVERSPVAAGPALQARTSDTTALVAIGVLVVSFLITILLIMFAL